MVKKIFLCMMLACVMSAVGNAQDIVIHPVQTSGTSSGNIDELLRRSPIYIPSVFQSDHTLTFEECCIGSEIEIVQNGFCTAQYDSHFALARLCRQIGHLNQSDYTANDGTGVAPSDVLTMLTQIGYYHTNWLTYTSGDIKADIDLDHVLLMSGYDTSGELVGHAWVADGYCDEETVYPNAGVNGADIVVQNTYNHINWGWNGRDNGYFLDDVWNTGDPEILDNTLSINHYNFNYMTKYLTLYPNN